MDGPQNTKSSIFFSFLRKSYLNTRLKKYTSKNGYEEYVKETTTQT